MDKQTLQWIEGCRLGERKAQLNFYNQFAQFLYAVCSRIVGDAEEAEEVMQDAFLKIFHHIGDYREGQSLKTWMRTIAVRTSIDYLRRHHPKMEELDDNMPLPEEEDLTEEEENKVMNSVAAIKEAVLRLSPGYRVVLTLYLFEGYDMDEIASILNLKPSSVRSQYQRGRIKLLHLMRKGGLHG